MATKRKLSQILDSISSENGKEVDRTIVVSKPRAFLTKLASLKRSKEVEKLKNVKSSSDLRSTKYAPWSRDAFLERLSTYSYRNWTVPSNLTEISPVECVKHGWVGLPVGGSAKENTIQCVNCLRIINVNVGGDSLGETRAQVQQLMAQKYRTRLVSEHVESCPWKAKGSDDKVYMFTVTVGQRGALLQRYQVLLEATSKEFLENCKLDYSPDILQELAEVRVEGDLVEAWQAKALVIALLGWKLESKLPDDSLVLNCIMCFRRAILKRNQELNLVDEHMSYCPLIKCQEDCAKPAWVQLFDYLRNTSVRPDLDEQEESSSLVVQPSIDEDDAVDQKRASRLSKLKEVYFKRQKR
ncbi:hypothetical protein TRVA0_040S01266 [Trichomonascus vanleenenianus]|uniref:uncharacterized protein n=1 Tax=Trichomonascus vanleenenianus TaxID=2268995 RepID=UPI003EC9C8B0